MFLSGSGGYIHPYPQWTWQTSTGTNTVARGIPVHFSNNLSPATYTAAGTILSR